MNSFVRNTTLRFSRRKTSDHALYEPLDRRYGTLEDDDYRKNLITSRRYGTLEDDDYLKNLTTLRRKVTSVDYETTSFGYKRDRAKKRLIYLQSYNLGSGNTSSNKMLKSRKLKKAAIRAKSVAESVVSFIRISSIMVCKSKLAVSVFSPWPSPASW